MKKSAVILIGTPGSGKGMQADLIADRLGLVHIDTGKLLRAILLDKSAKSDPVLRKERKLNNSGILNTPSFVVNVLKKRINTVAKMGYGIIFSGSPRTVYEVEALMPFMEKQYGKKNIHIFTLKVPLTVAAKRNGARLVCEICGRPLLTAFYPSKNPKHCPVCAGPLKRRIDDSPEKFKTRVEEYENRTTPILDYLKKRKYKIKNIDGMPPPYKVFEKLKTYL